MSERILEIDPEGSTLTKAIRAWRAEQDQARPAGLHLSTILEDRFKLLKDYGRHPMSVEQLSNYQEIGNLYEDFVAWLFKRKFTAWHKPEPKRFQRIWCSPDGFDGRYIDEMKAAWISARDFLELDENGRPVRKSLKFLRYEWQLLAYMKAFGVGRGRLHVWFVNGDYPKGAPAPMWPKTYLLKYSQDAIDENWDRIIEHAQDRGLLTAA